MGGKSALWWKPKGLNLKQVVCAAMQGMLGFSGDAAAERQLHGGTVRIPADFGIVADCPGGWDDIAPAVLETISLFVQERFPGSRTIGFERFDSLQLYAQTVSRGGGEPAIMISCGAFMDLIDSRGVLAGVLAHEVGHVVLNHNERIRLYRNGRSHEVNASNESLATYRRNLELEAERFVADFRAWLSSRDADLANEMGDYVDLIVDLQAASSERAPSWPRGSSASRPVPSRSMPFSDMGDEWASSTIADRASFWRMGRF